MIAAFTLAGCSFAPPEANRSADVIVIGDSILAWHRGTGRGIPDVVGQSTGLVVSNVSISGATFLGPQGIPTQFVQNDWDWVILDGGGNDLLPVCGTANGPRVLDALISEDGARGAIPAFINSTATPASRIIVLGYYPISDRGGPFVPCRALLNALAARQARMADNNPSVIFVDSGRVIGASDAGAYAPDRVHPSPRGAALIAQLIASTMSANDG